MSIIKTKINERLAKPQVPIKKQIAISLKEECIEKLDLIAKALSGSSGKTATRNMLIEDAIEAYIEEAADTLKASNIDIQMFLNDDDDFFDTVVYPAHNDGFIEAFLNENRWYYVRIKKDKIPRLKYVAIYRGAPESRITHYAKIANFEETDDGYVINLDGSPIKLNNPVPLGTAPSASVRAPRYTTLQKLFDALEYKDL
ncbi:MAG: ribbon-helix-helix domain-containing protein [Lachnospiraceae bacterium]|nr:ribbon-helix-helix domain-containing protein [Lachnospiraceae bacterium]